MALKILEIHHPALRVDGSESGLAANYAFYEGVLGLAADPKRPTLPGIPGLWINVGEVGQLHLIGGAQPSPLAKEGPDKDPAGPHVALAVQDVVEARAELDGWVSTTGSQWASTARRRSSFSCVTRMAS